MRKNPLVLPTFSSLTWHGDSFCSVGDILNAQVRHTRGEKLERPYQHLVKFSEKHKSPFQHADNVLSSMLKDSRRRSRFALMPTFMWDIIAQKHAELSLSNTELVLFAALGTWRYTKGIYRVHPVLFSGLWHAPLPPDEMPSNLFMRMPEWCGYLETPEVVLEDGVRLYGVFTLLDQLATDNGREMHLILDSNLGMRYLRMKLGQWPLTEALRRCLPEPGPSSDLLTRGLMLIWPILSVLAYMCNRKLECTTLTYLANAKLQRPKNLDKLTPPEYPIIWDIGKTDGEKLARYNAAVNNMTEDLRLVGMHIRKAHWHNHWCGKRGSQWLEARWHIPEVVGGARKERV